MNLARGPDMDKADKNERESGVKDQPGKGIEIPSHLADCILVLLFFLCFSDSKNQLFFPAAPSGRFFEKTPPEAQSDPADYEFAVKPQMKKYLCLWYMSTRNHNILYFMRI